MHDVPTPPVAAAVDDTGLTATSPPQSRQAHSHPSSSLGLRLRQHGAPGITTPPGVEVVRLVAALGWTDDGGGSRRKLSPCRPEHQQLRSGRTAAHAYRRLGPLPRPLPQARRRLHRAAMVVRRHHRLRRFRHRWLWVAAVAAKAAAAVAIAVAVCPSPPRPAGLHQRRDRSGRVLPRAEEGRPLTVFWWSLPQPALFLTLPTGAPQRQRPPQPLPNGATPPASSPERTPTTPVASAAVTSTIARAAIMAASTRPPPCPPPLVRAPSPALLPSRRVHRPILRHPLGVSNSCLISKSFSGLITTG